MRINIIQDSQVVIHLQIDSTKFEPDVGFVISPSLPADQVQSVLMRAIVSIVGQVTGGGADVDADIEIGRGPVAAAKA